MDSSLPFQLGDLRPSCRTGGQEQLLKKCHCLPLTPVRQDDRLRLAFGIADVTLPVESIHRIPSVALPRAGHTSNLEHGERQQSEDGIVYFVWVEFYRVRILGAKRSRYPARRFVARSAAGGFIDS